MPNIWKEILKVIAMVYIVSVHIFLNKKDGWSRNMIIFEMGYGKNASLLTMQLNAVKTHAFKFIWLIPPVSHFNSKYSQMPQLELSRDAFLL